MHFFLLFLLTTVEAATIGSIKQARISTLAPSTWLYNQSSWSKCMCYALQDPSIVAFNRFTSNSSCQLYKNLSSYQFHVIVAINVTIYLLQPLQAYSPCCSNLTWLLSQIKSVQKSVSISSMQAIALDAGRHRLGIATSYNLRLMSTDSFTLVNSTVSLPANSDAITYHQDLFYVGIYPPTNYTFYIYSALNLTLVKTISFTQGSPQHILWLYNETLVCIILERNSSLYSVVNFYNWPSFTLNNSIQIPITNAYALAKARNDDTFIYITDGLSGGDVWRMKTSSPNNFTLFTSTSTISEMPTSIAVDSCNRVWVGFYGYGIRIYDINSGAILGTWDLTTIYPRLRYMVLTHQYELYLVDIYTNALVRYGSALQCTN